VSRLPETPSSSAGEHERLARVALGRLGEPGDPRITRQVQQLGAARLYRRLCDDDPRLDLAADAAARRDGLDPAAELERAARQGIRFVVPGDPEWPGRLDDLDRVQDLHRRGGAPLGLWVRGPLRLDELCRRSVAVVGSRSATTYGASVAGQVAAELAGAGVTVVSGAAYGIDQAAHRGALSGGGPTVAVLACGADRAYPSAHRQLLDYIAETGLVVSEAPPGSAPTKLRFLSRNRLIAALTAGTVVVEAAVRSGALNTASWAGLLNRTVMGVPGPVTSAPSEGVHELIRSGVAILVTRGADVLELVSPIGTHTQRPPREPERPRDRLTAVQQQVLDAVPVATPAATASVARTAGVGERAATSALASLRSAGFVERFPGGWRLVAGDAGGGGR
jgi:DNA processing protein